MAPEARCVPLLLAESRRNDVLLKSDDEKQLNKERIFSWDNYIATAILKWYFHLLRCRSFSSF